MAVHIPDTHRDLLVEPIHGVLSTMMPDGQPQSSIVWVDYDGTYVLINTTLERQKGRNMRANPKVAVLVVDPKDVSRWIEVRGNVVEIRREGAEAHADNSRSGTRANSASMVTSTLSNKSIRKRASSSKSSQLKYLWMRFSKR